MNNIKKCRICGKEKNIKKMRLIESAIVDAGRVMVPVCKKHRCFGLINI